MHSAAASSNSCTPRWRPPTPTRRSGRSSSPAPTRPSAPASTSRGPAAGHGVFREVPNAELHHQTRRAGHTDPRCHQRPHLHRRPGDGVGLRFPDRLGAGSLRRYPCPRRHPARRRHDRAPAPGGGCGDGATLVDDGRGDHRRAGRTHRAGHRGGSPRPATGPRARTGTTGRRSTCTDDEWAQADLPARRSRRHRSALAAEQAITKQIRPDTSGLASRKDEVAARNKSQIRS